jgi:tetratricopeptide (TPR) repeat protein
MLLLLALEPRGQAQGVLRAPAATSPQQATAKRLVSAGNAAFEKKSYREAIELYQQAYALIPHPVLIFNIAQAQRLAGQLDEAARSYERYLAADPAGIAAASARPNLAHLRAARPADPDRAPSSPSPGDAPQVREREQLAPITAEASRAPASVASSPAQRGTPARPGRPLRIAGVAAGGVGLACVGAAVAFGLRVRAIQEEQIVERYDKDLPYDHERLRIGRLAERNQYIAAALAGTFVVGGAALYWAGGRRGRAAPATAWLPMIGPDGAGLAVTGALP